MPTCPTCRKRYPDGIATCTVDGERLLPDQAFLAVDADLQAGRIVGEYQIETKLGEGGFGAVYRAVHPLIGKAAAIKVLHRQFSSNPQMVSRFIAEARAVNQIRHRNIIDIFSFGALEDGRHYYVMELLEGVTFDRYIRQKGRLTPEETIGILRQVARALDAAHAAGIAHRDLKPENLFLTFDDDGVVFPKLLDFGIAKLLGESAAGHKTRTGTPMGTPNYMSPEQCRGKNVDHRTDVYSFGVMTFEALTGRLPFVGEDVMDVLMKHATHPAPPLSSVCTDLPTMLDMPLLHMLDKDPAKRPQSVSAALEALAVAAKEAGFAVTLSPVRAGDPRSRSGDGAVVASGPPGARSSSGGAAHATSAAGSIAHAPTLAQSPSGRSLVGAETDVRPAGARKTYFFLGTVAFLIGGIAIGRVYVRAHVQAPAATISAAEPRAPAPATTEPAQPTSIGTSPALPMEVEVRIQSEPKNVDIYLANDKIGNSANPVRLRRGDAPVKLTLKAEGYRPADIEVTPTDNTIVTAKLDRAAAAPKPHPQKPPGDLENPF